MRHKLIATFAAAIALTLSGCGGGSEPSTENAAGEASGETTLSVAHIGIAADACLHIGIDKGFFEEEGLNIETSTIANPPAGVAAAQSGELDLTYTPSIPMLNALAQGVPLKVIAAADGYAPGSLEAEDLSEVDDTGLYVRANSNISSPSELEGKTIAVPARGAQMEVTVAAAIQEDGGDPDKVNWVVLDFASALEALSAGRIDAASLVAPFTAEAESAGHEALVYPGVEFFDEGAVGLWVAGAQTAENKSEALEGFQQAIYRANEYCNNHVEEVWPVAAEVTQTPVEVVKQGATPYWPLEVTMEDIASVNTKLVDLGYLQQPAELGNLLFSPEE
ncbi:ABC transporter substrate-binding protein [Arthrobacter pigmenti]